MEKTFTVNGMKCPHCKAKVEDTLNGLDGVSKAVANLDNHSVTVEYDEGKVKPEQMKEVVDNAGRYELEL